MKLTNRVMAYLPSAMKVPYNIQMIKLPIMKRFFQKNRITFFDCTPRITMRELTGPGQYTVNILVSALL